MQLPSRMKVCSAKWFRVSNFRFRGLYAFRHLGCRALEVQGCYDLDAETLNRGEIVGSDGAFAALAGDGHVVTWGDSRWAQSNDVWSLGLWGAFGERV